MLKRKQGSLSVDFMFGVSFLSIAFIFVILTGLSLTYAEVAQYVTYSSARNYFPSNVTKQKAEEATKDKYKDLQSHFFTKTNWFSIGISGQPQSHDIFINNDPKRINLPNTPKRINKGVYTEYTSKVFGMKVPFLKKGQSRPMFFPTATVLGKETDQADCKRFFTAPNFNPNFFKNGC